jgi:hypothetical protein
MPEASGAEASPLKKYLSRRSIRMSSYLFFWLSHLWFRKDGFVDYYMNEGVHEGSDGQDARGHIPAEYYNYNFRRHPKH